MSEHPEEGTADDAVPPLVVSPGERAKAWRKAAYQKAKAANKERVAALKQTPAAIARKELQAEYRRATYQKLKAQRKAQKEKAKPAAKAEIDASDLREPNTDSEQSVTDYPDLRLLLTTADKLPPRAQGLRLVKPADS